VSNPSVQRYSYTRPLGLYQQIMSTANSQSEFSLYIVNRLSNYNAHAQKKRATAPKYYVFLRNTDATQKNGGHPIKTATHSQLSQATCQSCHNHGQSHRPYNTTCHADNHH